MIDPLNSYAHLGMPEPFVHLISPPLDLSLDSRIPGNSAPSSGTVAAQTPFFARFYAHVRSARTLSFGVFALRDLDANEEVALRWEWDDIHR